MPFRFRKSLRITKSLRLNVSKGGASLSARRKGASVSLGRKGARTTAGVPGSGVSYSKAGCLLPIALAAVTLYVVAG